MALILCAATAAVNATDVMVAGIFPGKALLVINGAAPRTLAVGQSFGELRLISVEREAVVIEAGGKRERITIGGPGYRLGEDSDDGSQTLTLAATPQGQFFLQGSLNDASMGFLVDTGASAVAMGPSQARQAGLNYTAGEHAYVGTANGNTHAWRVRIDRLKLGGIVLRDVEGLVLQQEVPVVLLGMSALKRLSMTREGNTMTLKRRY